MTATVCLTAQMVMVRAALLAGWLCDTWGRKPVLSMAFWGLALRIFSHTLAGTPPAVVYLHGLDGVGAGIYGVALASLQRRS